MIKAIVLALCTAIFPISAAADMRQIPDQVPHFEVGLFHSNFSIMGQPQGLSTQRRQNWCWAATAAFAMQQQGLPVTQEQIVGRLFGGYLPDQPASIPMIVAAATGWGLDMNGIPHTVRAEAEFLPLPALIEELKAERPVLISAATGGAVNHMYAVVAVEYVFPSPGSPFYSGGYPVLHAVTLLDPWPESPRLQKWSRDEFSSRLSGMVQVRVY